MVENIRSVSSVKPDTLLASSFVERLSINQMIRNETLSLRNHNQASSVDKLISITDNKTESEPHSNYNHLDTPANHLLSMYTSAFKNQVSTGPIITVVQTSQLPIDKLIVPIDKNGTTPDNCRAPLSKKFGHPCTCLPTRPTYYPASLYDPASNSCLQASSTRPRLLKECTRNNPCAHPDLVCDQRKQRCNCRPTYHLYYETNKTLGCMPIDLVGGGCKKGHFWNLKTQACQKAFDINELSSSFQPVLSATQFSFVSIVLLWILLLILILTAKLRKLKSIHTVRRQLAPRHRRIRHDTNTASQWLHPFITAVSGHHHQTLDRQSLSLSVDDPLAHDSEVYLNNTGRRAIDMLSSSNFARSTQSINNPPPKFEDIYPQHHSNPSWNEDLPSYEEAIKMQDQHTDSHDNSYRSVVKVFMNGTEYQSFPT